MSPGEVAKGACRVGLPATQRCVAGLPNRPPSGAMPHTGNRVECTHRCCEPIRARHCGPVRLTRSPKRPARPAASSVTGARSGTPSCRGVTCDVPERTPRRAPRAPRTPRRPCEAITIIAAFCIMGRARGAVRRARQYRRGGRPASRRAAAPPRHRPGRTDDINFKRECDSVSELYALQLLKCRNGWPTCQWEGCSGSMSVAAYTSAAALPRPSARNLLPPAPMNGVAVTRDGHFR